MIPARDVPGYEFVQENPVKSRSLWSAFYLSWRAGLILFYLPRMAHFTAVFSRFLFYRDFFPDTHFRLLDRPVFFSGPLREKACFFAG